MRPQLWAHRGANRRAPENTLAAFRIALEEGADGIELDVRTARSGEVVVAHDPHFGRLADRAAWVARLPLSRLRAIDLGGGERIPLLDEAIDLVVGAGKRLNVEVKGDVPDRQDTARAVNEVLARRRPEERDAIVLSTFDGWVFRLLERQVPIGLLIEPRHAIRSAIELRLLRPDGVHPHHSQCTEDRVAAWKRRGLFVNVWTVNAPTRAAELAAMGVDGIITDDVPALAHRSRRSSQ